MNKLLSIVFTMLFIQSLCAQSGKKPQVINLNLAESFSRQQEVSLSRFVEKVTFIPLKSNPKALISDYSQFEVADEFIIVKSFIGGVYHIWLFDRKSGKFLREIGKYGKRTW